MPICHLKKKQHWTAWKIPILFSIFTLLSAVGNNKFSNITLLAVVYANKTKENSEIVQISPFILWRGHSLIKNNFLALSQVQRPNLRLAFKIFLSLFCRGVSLTHLCGSLNHKKAKKTVCSDKDHKWKIWGVESIYEGNLIKQETRASDRSN